MSNIDVYGIFAVVVVTSIDNLLRERCLPFASWLIGWWRISLWKISQIRFINLLLLLPFLVLLATISADVGGAASAVSFFRHSLTMNLL